MNKFVRPGAKASRSKIAAYGEQPPRRAAGTEPPALSRPRNRREMIAILDHWLKKWGYNPDGTVKEAR